MKDKIISHFFTKLSEIKSWKSKRKIFVIESDDWGSIRMPNKDVFNKLLKQGYPVDNNPYEKYDSLASDQDIEALFDVLSSIKDKHGNNAVMTPNVIMTNPDFEKIEKNQFEEYHFQHFTDTLQSYGKTHQNVFKLWKQGHKEHIFHPQYHGREHLNINTFMNALANDDKDLKAFFKHKAIGALRKNDKNAINDYVETNRFKSQIEGEKLIKNYLDGHDLFTKTFGFESKTVIPPNYIWSPSWNMLAKEKGIMAFQGLSVINEPNLKSDKPKAINKYRVYTGKLNQYDQLYLVRNAFFEPSTSKLSNTEIISKSLSKINQAFSANIPAIISSHRLNYVGVIDESNRTNNLRILEQILKTVIQKWPEVEFMSSDQLVNEIRNS